MLLRIKDTWTEYPLRLFSFQPPADGCVTNLLHDSVRPHGQEQPSVKAAGVPAASWASQWRLGDGLGLRVIQDSALIPVKLTEIKIQICAEGRPGVEELAFLGGVTRSPGLVWKSKPQAHCPSDLAVRGAAGAEVATPVLLVPKDGAVLQPGTKYS